MGNPEEPGYTEIDAIVDAGATLAVVPRELADKFGLEVTGEATVQTGAGVLKLPRSRAWVEVEGKSEVIPILISDVIDRVLI